MDSDGGSVNSHEVDLVPANGNIYTNWANDNSMEICFRFPSLSLENDSLRSRSCSSLSSSLITVHNNFKVGIYIGKQAIDLLLLPFSSSSFPTP